MTLDVTNRSQFLAGVQNAFTDLELDSEESLAVLAKDMSQLMREGAPVMDEAERRQRQATEGTRKATRRKPGRVTIRFRRGRDQRGFYIDVGPSKSAFHLAFAEWGTSRQPARPFLRPAIERAIARWR